jgi:AraC-like DNA-binding protein
LIIEELLPDGYPTIERVALRMGTSVRTLQRHLHQADTTYSLLVDVVRRDLARQQLEATHLHVSELAKQLGFKDHSSFSRAFMRWMGVSPRAYRQALDRQHDQVSKVRRGNDMCLK